MEEEGHPSTSRNQANERDDGDEESEKSYNRREFDDCYSDSSASQAPPSEKHVPEVKLERVRSLNGHVSKHKKLNKRGCRQGRVEKRSLQRQVKQTTRHSPRVLDKARRQLSATAPSVPCLKMHQCPRCGHLNRFRK